MRFPRQEVHFLYALMIFILMIFVYLISMPTVVPHSLDALYEISLAKQAKPELRPNHLILTPLHHGYLSILNKAGAKVPDFIQLQLLTSVMGATCCPLFFLFLKSEGCRQPIAVLGTLIMAFSYAPWMHSREVETGVFPQTFMILTLLLISISPRQTRSSSRIAVIVTAAIAGSLMILTSMQYVLVYPFLCIMLFLEIPKQHRIALVGTFGAVSIVLTLAVYIPAFAATGHELGLKSFLAWIGHHPREHTLSSVKTLSMMGLLRSLVGIVNYFVGPSPVATVVKMSLKGEQSIPIPLISWLRFIFGLLVAGFLGCQFLRGVRSKERMQRLALLLAAIVPLLIFNSMWSGSDPQFWMPGIPLIIWQACLIMSMDSGFPFRDSAIKLALIASVAGLVVINSHYPVPTRFSPDGGEDWKIAREFCRLTEKNSLVLFAGGWGWYLSTLGDQGAINLLEFFEGNEKGEGILRLSRKINSVLNSNGHVYAVGIHNADSPDFLNPWEMMDNAVGLSREEFVINLDSLYSRSVFLPDSFGSTVWELRFKNKES